jgi:hypothetical protein
VINVYFNETKKDTLKDFACFFKAKAPRRPFGKPLDEPWSPLEFQLMNPRRTTVHTLALSGTLALAGSAGGARANRDPSQVQLPRKSIEVQPLSLHSGAQQT